MATPGECFGLRRTAVRVRRAFDALVAVATLLSPASAAHAATVAELKAYPYLRQME